MNIQHKHLQIHIFIISLVLGITAVILTLKLEIPPTYTDFIVGNLAWSAGDKLQDLTVWPIFIFILFSSHIILKKITNLLTKKNSINTSLNFTNQLLIWSLPFYIGIGNLLLTNQLNNTGLIISLVGIFFISITFILLFYKNSLNKFNPNLPSTILITIIFISLIPLEANLLLNRIFINSTNGIYSNILIKISHLLFFSGIALAILSSLRYENMLKIYLPKIIFISQLGLPFLFLTLYPAKLNSPTGELNSYHTTIYLKIFISILVTYCFYDIIKKFINYNQSNDWDKLFSPIAIFALIIVLKFGNTVLPKISHDDYHFGESLLGWWSYMHGIIPYLEYMPAHGFIDDDFTAFLSFIFYDGSASTLANVQGISFAILGLIAFMSIKRFTGSVFVAFIVILLLAGSRLSWFFIIPFICLWLSPYLRNNPEKWLITWIFTVPILILGIPSQGILLTIAFGILASKILLEQMLTGNKSSWIKITVSLLILFIILFSTPLFSMLSSSIHYVLENGATNQLTYGIPWNISTDKIILELSRMSWVIFSAICLYVIFNNINDFKIPTSLLYPACVFFIFSILLIPYSMGRIDAHSISRAGAISILCWLVLFPILFSEKMKNYNQAIYILLFSFIASLLGYGNNISYTSLISSTTSKISAPPLKNTAELGLPNIGLAIINENHLNRIINLNTLLKSRLENNESYLDLSSRNAHYFYVNRLPILPISAAYNLAPPIQQKKALNILQKNPPKIVLLQADNIIHDGGGLPLRNPYIYKFIINNYEPRFEYGFVVGYKKSDINTRNSVITAEIRNFTDKNWIRGFNRTNPAIILSDPNLISMLRVGDQIKFNNNDLRSIEKIWKEGNVLWLSGNMLHPIELNQNLIQITVSPQVKQEYDASLFQRAFPTLDLKKIPVAWGKSYNSLKNKMSLIASLDDISPTLFHLSKDDKKGHYRVNGHDPQIIFDISNLDISGKNTGLLKFDFVCINPKESPKFQIFWWGDERNYPFEESSLRFSTENNSTLIVPLDSSPRWTLLEKIKGIRIDLDNTNACHSFSIKNLALYQRVQF